MSYKPTQWKAGDTVTSAKLNKLEQGVANSGGILVVHDDGNGTLDKTWQEIYDAGLAVIQAIDNDGTKYANLIERITATDNTYYVLYGSSSYSTSSPTDYPAFTPTEVIH